MENSKSLHDPKGTPLWRDERFLRILGQVVFLVLLFAGLSYLTRNMLANMRQQGLGLGFSFVRLTAGFDIGEHMIPYDRSHTYLQAFLVGLLNTALVSSLGIFFATILGIAFGIARISTNFIVQLLARIYIEILRNIPLLVLLIFLFTGVFIQFPRVKEAVPILGGVLMTNRGVAIPWGIPTETFQLYLRFLAIGLLLAVVVGLGLAWYGRRTGRAPLIWVWSFLAFLVFSVLGWVALPSNPLTLETPGVQGLRLAGGKQLSPEFMALLTGLVIYTSAFIADVVRAGILAVSRGQVEAAKSMGLTGFQTMRLVVFPQAMRVIVPPLTSQYLNLTKNSSLAVAIGYPDLFHVAGTINNQSGRVVEVIALVMGIYLSISLLTSALMNWYNRRVRLVER
ncbi:MAG TPA: ABC transporter permease subunit [Anaerolineales bacterium]|nr:ABC transporter permease subunit [Anaerolineales bacterium]